MSVRGVLLALLAEGERHGYQLKVDFEERTGGLWSLNVGQVYTTLDRMVRDGVAEEVGSGDADQRQFGITEPGRRELKEWLGSSPVDGPPPRDELIMKVLVAMRGNRAAARDLVDQQRAALLAALQTGRRRARAHGDADSATALAADAFLGRLEADIAWLDRCEARLNDRNDNRRRR